MKRIAAAAMAIVISLSCTGCGIGEHEELSGAQQTAEQAEIDYNALTLPDNGLAAVSTERASEEAESAEIFITGELTADTTENGDLAAAPCSGADCVGLNYRDVAVSFASAGFEDISLVECHAEGFSEGEVVFVLIDGSDIFSEGDEFSRTAPVMICCGCAEQTTASTKAETTVTTVGAGSGEGGHSGGSVTVPEKEETVGQLVWVPTKGGKKYHRSAGCSNMKDPMQVSVETAIANGYTPCKRCY